MQAARLGEQRSAADVLTGIALGQRPDVNGDHHLRLAACARLLATGVAHAEFAGHVGDCCDDEDASGLVRPPAMPPTFTVWTFHV